MKGNNVVESQPFIVSALGKGRMLTLALHSPVALTAT
jgi:hypothetical protein